MTNSASKRKREDDDESRRLAKLERRARKKAKQSQEAPAEVTSTGLPRKEDAEHVEEPVESVSKVTNGTNQQEPSPSGKKNKKQRKTAADMWNKPETVAAPPATNQTTAGSTETPSNEAITARPEVKARRDRKKQKARDQPQPQAIPPATDGTAITKVGEGLQIPANVEKPQSTGEKKRSVKKNEQRREKRDKWKVSNAIGGRFIDADPVFTPDEKYAKFSLLCDTFG